MTGAIPESKRLIGRASELERLRLAIENDRAVLVTGEPGIGKTTLIRAAITSTDRRRYEGGGFATLAWRPRLALSRAVGSDLSGDADWVADLVERVVGPDVLFIDDLQWVDASTVAVIERLVGRIAIVMATRSDGVALDVFSSETGAMDRLDLTPLDPSETAELARRVSPSISEAKARSIAARAAGNPFLAEQLATSGETAGLRRAVAHRLRTLDPTEVQALRLLALAERPIAEATFEDGGRRLLELGLAERTGGGLTARHALLADAVVDSLEPDELIRLHARLADAVDDAGERARHLLAAGDRPAAFAAAMDAVAGSATAGERAAHLGLAAAAADGPDGDVLRIEAAAALRTAGDLLGANCAPPSSPGSAARVGPRHSKRWSPPRATPETPRPSCRRPTTLSRATRCTAVRRMVGRWRRRWAIGHARCTWPGGSARRMPSW